MKKFYFLAIIYSLHCSHSQRIFGQDISNFFWSCNFWMPGQIPVTSNSGWPGGYVDYPNVQQFVKNAGSVMYRIAGNGYDEFGTAIGVDTTDNDYIFAIQKVRNVNPNSKFIIQVPVKAGLTDTTKMSPSKAALLVFNVGQKFPTDTFYYALGNEIDRYINPITGTKFSSADLKTIIIDYSTQMKLEDHTIRIMAPSLSSLNETDSAGKRIMKRLIGGADDITGVITGTGNPNLDGNKFFCDVADFHSYRGGNYGDMSGIDSSNFWNYRDTLIAYSSTGFKNDLDSLQSWLAIANANRPLSPLTFAVGEMNICWKNPTGTVEGNRYTNSTEGIGCRSHFCGQYLADLSSAVLESGTKPGNARTEFFAPWSIHESNGNGTFFDLGMTKDTAALDIDPIPLSSYYHYQLLSQHFLAKYYPGVSSISPLVKTFASMEAAGFYVMILNRDTSDYDFNIGFNNAYSSNPATLQLKFDSAGTGHPFDEAIAWPDTAQNDSIKRESTILLQFDCHGTQVMKLVYSLQDALTDSAPHLRKIGNIDVDPQFFSFSQFTTIGGTITQNKSFINDTVYIASDILLAGPAKLSFDHSVVIVASDAKILATPMASIEIKNNTVMFGAEGKQFEGIEMIGNYNNGERLHIENSFMFNAKHPVKTEKIPDLKIIGNVFANGETAIELNRSEAFTVSANLIGGYKTGIKTSKTKAGYVSGIKENRFIEIVTDVEFKDDIHDMLEITCNEFRYKDRAVKSRNSELKEQGEATTSAGNKFIYESIGQPINYVDHTGTPTKYFFGPAEANEFSYPNVMNIPKVQAVSDRVCSTAFANDCGEWINAIEEDGKTMPQILIYPNPNNGTFTVSLSEVFNGETKINVQDILGRTVTTQKLKTGNHLAKLTLTVAGIYFVTIENNGKRFAEKVIMQ